MTERELFQRRALLHRQAAILLRQEADRHEEEAKKIDKDNDVHSDS